MTPVFEKLRGDILDHNLNNAPRALTRAVLLLAEQVHELVEQNRGTGVFRMTLLAVLRNLR